MFYFVHLPSVGALGTLLEDFAARWQERARIWISVIPLSIIKPHRMEAQAPRKVNGEPRLTRSMQPY